MHKLDSLKKRYVFKVMANVCIFSTGAITQAIIPRGLGPKLYGDFSFLSSFFNQLVAFFEMGTSSCFYTKFSQRPKEMGLVSFYTYFSTLILTLLLIFVQLMISTGFYARIWPGQQILYIYLATGFGFLSWFVPLLGGMADAYGITVISEKVKMLQRLFAVFFIVLLFVFGQLNLLNFFYYQYIILLLLGSALFVILRREGYFLKESFNIGTERIKKYAKEFYSYSHPIFIYSLISLIGNLFDRWLLQIFGGSIEQGFYGFSFQIGGLCFLFTSAMTPLLAREFSIAHFNTDFKRMVNLYNRYIPLFYAIAAYISCFIVIQANKVIYIMGGKAYKYAFVPLIILSFYPLHQTYGQLCGSIYYATGQTKLYRNIGIISILLGLPLTYVLIAPKNVFGLNLGATGLAIKTELIAIISVNLLLWFNVRQLKLSFKKFFFHQIYTVILFILLAAVIAGAIDLLISNIFISFILSGIIYTISTVFILFNMPSIFSIKKIELLKLISKFKSKILKKRV